MHEASFYPIIIPFLIGPEEYIIYWEGPHQNIVDSELRNYLNKRGYRFIQYPDLHLLKCIYESVTEEMLSKAGLPNYVSLVLPSTYEYVYPPTIQISPPGKENIYRTRFPGISRSFFGSLRERQTKKGKKIFFFEPDWDGYKAFILCKK